MKGSNSFNKITSTLIKSFLKRKHHHGFSYSSLGSAQSTSNIKETLQTVDCRSKRKLNFPSNSNNNICCGSDKYWNLQHSSNKPSCSFKPSRKSSSHQLLCSFNNNCKISAVHLNQIRYFSTNSFFRTQRYQSSGQDTIKSDGLDQKYSAEDQDISEDLDKERVRYLKNKILHEQWSLRVANENTYLSWCRNSYLGTMVGVAVNIQSLVPFNKDVAFVFFLLAGFNLTIGTSSYVFNMWYLRKHLDMSTFTTLVYILLCLTHLLVWLGGITIYLGIVEDEEDYEEDLHVKPPQI